MTEKRASIEVIAPMIEEAVAKGLADLGLAEDAVEIEVLDPGSKGVFGLGTRLARVRLTIKSEFMQSETAPVVEPPAPVVGGVSEAAEIPQDEEKSEETGSHYAGLEDDLVLQVARETVEDLLERMKVTAQVTAHFGQLDDPRSRAPVWVDIHGDDLSILIGPQAETLNALQYISGLILGKEVGRLIPLTVDVEGFRARRAQQIRQIARRMAEQAVKTGKRQYLEPMPASERRLVHIELRDHPQVKTESTGEEPRRKVTIVPK